MTVTLPADVRERAQRQAKAAGFASVGDYLADLVREDVVEDGPPPDPLGGYSYEELGKLLDTGMKGPWLPMDKAFWERQHERLLKKAAELGITE